MKVIEFVQVQDRYAITKAVPVMLSENALNILNSKNYLRGETPEEMFERVAEVATKPLLGRYDATERNQVKQAFYNMMAFRDFMPNSPTLTNAGRGINQLAACFVVPVEDSMEGIFCRAIPALAMIQRTGGGTGFDFSSLRPEGDLVTTTAGTSSGPISFMQAFDACTETIKQGGVRRGANMGILRIDHPDIIKFIRLKENRDCMHNFNLSVAITDEFMECLRDKKPFNLRFKDKVYATVDPRELMDLIADRAWHTGDPGIVFIDTINKYNPMVGLPPIAATNPCGEQPLGPFEACNLGSINLANFVNHDRTLDVNGLTTAVRLAVMFLDCIIDAGKYPLSQIDENVKANRKIGLGIMGLADYLIKRRIPYGSEQGRKEAAAITKLINETAMETSQWLAKEFGTFPNYEFSNFTEERRNATVTTIAPTGTIAMIADTSYGIEPKFALAYTKRVVGGDNLLVVDKLIDDFLTGQGVPADLREVVIEQIQSEGTVKNISKKFPFGEFNGAMEAMEQIFATAQDLTPKEHLLMQAALQQNVENAVSKTINFKNDVTVEDIKEAFMLAYELELKGVTVYRDGSLDSQPVIVGTKEVKRLDDNMKEIDTPPLPEELDHLETNARIDAIIEQYTRPSASECLEGKDKYDINSYKRPSKLVGQTQTAQTGCGMLLTTINTDGTGEIKEILLRAGSNGGCSAMTDAVARLLSISLRYGIPPEILIDQLCSVRCDNFRFQVGRNPDLKGRSCADIVGKQMQAFIAEQKEITTMVNHDLDTLVRSGVLTESQAEALKNIKQTPINSGGAFIPLANSSTASISVCPECGAKLNFAEGCKVCTCGWSKC